MALLNVGTPRFAPLSRGGRFAAFAMVAIVGLLDARDARAQGEINGRVFVDSARVPVRGVEASIARLRLSAMSDSSGRFRLRDVPPGEHLVVLRAAGFRTESSTVMIDRDEVVSLDVAMTRSTTLPERVISAPEARAPAHLVEFNERRQAGVGHFITREHLAKAEGGLRRTGDVIAAQPGVNVRRGSNKIWIASSRTTRTGNCAFCVGDVSSLNRADVAAGARPACFMDVYVDGAMVYDARHPENGLYDVNTIPPEHIAGIEVYSSAAQVPAKYNRTGAGCGVLLIWTR